MAAVLVLHHDPWRSVNLRPASKNCSIKTVKSLPIQELKSALRRSEEMRGWRWNCRPSPIAGRHARDEMGKPTPSVRLDLTVSDTLLLATLLNAVADPSWDQQLIRGTVPVLPDLGEDETWLTTSQVAERLGVAPKTITGWTARGGPKACPFPKGTQIHYRNYWPASVIDQWDSEWKRAGSKAAAG